MNRKAARVTLVVLFAILPIVGSLITAGEPPAGTQPAASQPAVDGNEQVPEDPDEEARGLYHQLVQDAERKLRRNMRITGRVVDGEGRPLDGVTVHVEKWRDMSGVSGRRDVEKHPIGEKFVIDIEGSPFATVEFSKPSYYRETMEVGWIGDRLVASREDQVVVLEKKGILTHLYEVPVLLETEFSGEAIVLTDEVFRKPHVKKPTVRLAAGADQADAVLRIASTRGPNGFLFRELSAEGSQVVRYPFTTPLSLPRAFVR